MRKGQYRLPFSFKLPADLPGSTKIRFNDNSEYSIRYKLEISVVNTNNVKGITSEPILACSSALTVREYFLSEQEINKAKSLIK